jgi:hypothetical protein
MPYARGVTYDSIDAPLSAELVAELVRVRREQAFAR